MASDFFQAFFIDPILQNQGYNPVNTLAYFGVLFLLAFYVIFPQLNKRGIKMDFSFVLALFPYILFGVLLRVINFGAEMGLFPLPFAVRTVNLLEPGFWMYTPGVWFATFALVLAGMLLAWRLSNGFGEKFTRFLLAIGLLVDLPLLAWVLFSLQSWLYFLGVGLVVVALVLLLSWAFSRFTPWKILKDRMNVFALAGQALDGTATFFAVGFFGYGEQHPLSRALLGVNPALFLAAKLALILLLLYFIDRDYGKDSQLNGFIKLLLIILGFATGGASLFKLGLTGALG